ASPRGRSGRDRAAAWCYACASSSAGVSTGQSLRIRLPRRASTLPGPTSTNRRAPASCMASTVSRQRTGRVRTSVSSARTSVAGAGGGVEPQRVPAGQAGAEDGGLREAGGLARAREGILAHERDAALEQLGGAVRDEVAHVRCLAALAGEERDRGRGVGDQGH